MIAEIVSKTIAIMMDRAMIIKIAKMSKSSHKSKIKAIRKIA